MWQAIVFSFLAGLLGGNAFPHFVHGSTRKCYPNVLGNGPVIDFLSGWAGLVIAALLLYWVHGWAHPAFASGSGAIGVMLIGFVHAGPGAFGPKPKT